MLRSDSIFGRGLVCLALSLAVTGLGCGKTADDATSAGPPTDHATTSAEPDPRGEPASDAGSQLSLLVVTLDTTRADHLAPYGAGDVETPTLARLAVEGVLFEHAVAVAPVTLPSHASLFTGLYPPHHGVRNNGSHYLDSAADTLAERLQSAGLSTAAMVSAAVLDRRYGLDQGFDLYDDDLSQGGPRQLRLNAERPARVTIDAARRWLDQLGPEKRFFLWLHLFDPHAPYDPPSPWAERYRERPYDGEIAALDAELARLLEHPRLERSQSVVMVLADHGESLGEHGEDTHAMLLYDATLRIPWLIRAPGLPAGRRVVEPVSQVDLLPTVLELLDIVPGTAPPTETGHQQPLDGRSLVTLMRDGAGQSDEAASVAERTLYSETLVPLYTYGWSELRTVRQSNFKYVAAPEPELYDLADDPAELHDIKLREAARVETLERALAIFDQRVVAASELPRDPDMEARLRSLGYLSPTTAPGERQRLDPKRVIDLHLAVERGQDLFYRRRSDEAESELRRVLARDHDNLQALVTLAKVRVLQNRLEEATELAHRAVALDPENPELHVVVGQVAASRGEDGVALEAFEAALAFDPRWLDAAIERVRCLERLGRRDEAMTALEDLLEQDGDHGRSQVAWAELVELPAGDLAAAEERARKVLARDPELAEAWRVLGQVLEAGERWQDALALYRQAVERLPGEGTLHARYGALLARVGQPEAALQELERALVGGQDTVSVNFGLASLAIRRGDWERVERHARRTLELDPQHSGAWNLLAASQEELGRPAEALTAYDRALEQDPQNWRAQFNRALLLVRGARYDAAAAAFEEVLTRQPEHAGAHFELGVLYAGPLHDPTRAASHLRRSLEIEPDHPRAAEIRRLLAAN